MRKALVDDVKTRDWENCNEQWAEGICSVNWAAEGNVKPEKWEIVESWIWWALFIWPEHDIKVHFAWLRQHPWQDSNRSKWLFQSDQHWALADTLNNGGGAFFAVYCLK